MFSKMRIFNSLIVPKNLKGGTLWDFSTFVLLQNIKQMKGGLFGDIKKFSKKCLTKPKRRESHSAEKESLIVPKKLVTFCFGMLSKK